MTTKAPSISGIGIIVLILTMATLVASANTERGVRESWLSTRRLEDTIHLPAAAGYSYTGTGKRPKSSPMPNSNKPPVPFYPPVGPGGSQPSMQPPVPIRPPVGPGGSQPSMQPPVPIRPPVGPGGSQPSMQPPAPIRPPVGPGGSQPSMQPPVPIRPPVGFATPSPVKAKPPVSTPQPFVIPAVTPPPVSAPIMMPVVTASPVVTPPPIPIPSVTVSPAVTPPPIPMPSVTVSPVVTPPPSMFLAPTTRVPAPTVSVYPSLAPSSLLAMTPSVPLSSSISPSSLSNEAGIDCLAIASGNATQDGNIVNYEVKFALVVDNSASFSNVTEGVRQILQEQVAPEMAGCPSRRMLVDTMTYIINQLFFTPESDSTGKWHRRKNAFNFLFITRPSYAFHLTASPCNTESANSTCYPTLIPTDIYYIGDDTSSFESRLVALIDKANADGTFAGIPGFVNMTAVTVTADNDSGASGATGGGSTATTGGISGGATAIVAIAGVGLIVVLLLLVRHRKNSDPSESRGGLKYTSHDDDESFDLDAVSTHDSTEGPGHVKTRNVRVIGEDDSVMSGWSGFHPHEGFETQSIVNDLSVLEKEHKPRCHPVAGLHGSSSQGVYRSATNVHTCTSALCETCELRRQGGPSFIPVGKPPGSPTRFPSNATRVYATRDTVDL